DRLADVARLELGQLLPVRRDRVGERVQQARALRARRLAPGPVERDARRLDRAIDVDLAGHRRAREWLAGRRLAQVPHLAGGGLDELAADEEPVLALGRDSHGQSVASRSPTRTGSVRRRRNRAGSPFTNARHRSRPAEYVIT